MHFSLILFFVTEIGQGEILLWNWCFKFSLQNMLKCYYQSSFPRRDVIIDIFIVCIAQYIVRVSVNITISRRLMGCLSYFLKLSSSIKIWKSWLGYFWKETPSLYIYSILYFAFCPSYQEFYLRLQIQNLVKCAKPNAEYFAKIPWPVIGKIWFKDRI